MTETPSIPDELKLEAAFLQLQKFNRPAADEFMAAMRLEDETLVNAYLGAPNDEIFQAQGALGMFRGLFLRLQTAETRMKNYEAQIEANARRITP